MPFDFNTFGPEYKHLQKIRTVEMGMKLWYECV